MFNAMCFCFCVNTRVCIRIRVCICDTCVWNICCLITSRISASKRVFSSVFLCEKLLLQTHLHHCFWSNFSISCASNIDQCIVTHVSVFVVVKLYIYIQSKSKDVFSVFFVRKHLHHCCSWSNPGIWCASNIDQRPRIIQIELLAKNILSMYCHGHRYIYSRISSIYCHGYQCIFKNIFASRIKTYYEILLWITLVWDITRGYATHHQARW